MVPFDTLKMSEKLQKAGFTREQADGMVLAIAEAFSKTPAVEIRQNDIPVILECLVNVKSLLDTVQPLAGPSGKASLQQAEALLTDAEARLKKWGL